MSDSVSPQVTPTGNFYTAGAYPFRRVRFRSDIEREDVWTGDANVRRPISFGGRTGYWKAGAKLVNRDQHQDRTNENYNGSGTGLGDFGLAGPEPRRSSSNTRAAPPRRTSCSSRTVPSRARTGRPGGTTRDTDVLPGVHVNLQAARKLTIRSRR